MRRIPTSLPYRGTFGDARPPALANLPLPPGPMPSRHGLRALKAWRYLGVYGPELMLCMASVRVGPARQAFWAVWDRAEQRLHERTVTGRGPLWLWAGGASLRDGELQVELALDEATGIETVCAAGEAYAWTRKQGGVRAHGTVSIDGRTLPIDGHAIIDDTAAYYPRHTSWRWSAGVGTTADGRPVAWNLVSGVNDPPTNSERTIWVDGEPVEAPPSAFADDLSAVDGLTFHPEAERREKQNLIVVRSEYRQPFGTFSGTLPNGIALSQAYGVMEEHDAWW
ncbi:MAG: DUF2804 family protein [Solirubrobacteraceae bacterium]